MTSLFKFRFCFAGGSLHLKQKPYSPGTVTSDYFQWHFQLFPITIPGTRGKRSHVLQHEGFSEQRIIYQTSAEKGTEQDFELSCGRVILEQICWRETQGWHLVGCWGILLQILPRWVILRKLLHFPQVLTGTRTHFSAATCSFCECLLNAPSRVRHEHAKVPLMESKQLSVLHMGNESDNWLWGTWSKEFSAICFLIQVSL